MTEIYCVLNGISMTEKEFKCWKKDHSKNKVVVAKQPKVVTYHFSDLVHSWLSQTVKKVKVLNSILSYQRYSYRYWGNIARTVLHIKEIEKPFDKTYVSILKLQRTMSAIEKSRRKSETVELLRKLSWQLEEVSNNIVALNNGIRDSEVCYGLCDCGCINSTGKRLGLKTISYKAGRAVDELKDHREDIAKLIELANY